MFEEPWYMHHFYVNEFFSNICYSNKVLKYCHNLNYIHSFINMFLYIYSLIFKILDIFNWNIVTRCWFQVYKRKFKYTHILYIYIDIYTFSILFHYRLLQDSGYSSLCHIVDPYCLSIIYIYIIVYMLILNY